MEKKTEDFSMGDAMRLAQSDAGKQLFAALQQKDSHTLQQAMRQAAAGDFAQVKQTMSDLLRDPQIRELLNRLGGNQNG